MTLELIIIPIVLFLSLVLLVTNFKAAINLLLVLSLLLHKELFSIYRWDLLPVRVFMLAVLAYGVILALYELKKAPSYLYFFRSCFSFLKDPFIFLMFALWWVRGISIVFTKNLEHSIFLFGFFTTITVLCIILYKKYNKKPDEVLGFIRKYIYLVFGACLFGFIQIVIHWRYDTVIASLWPVPGNIPRVGSVFWDVNHFAALIASLMPVLGVFILIDPGRKKKALNALMFFVMLAILLLTNSRTSFMIAFFSFISFVTLLLYKRFRYKGVVVLILTLILIFVPIASEYSDKSSPFRAKVKDYFHYRIDSFDSHILLLRGSVAVFEEMPFIGGGYGSFFEHFSETDVAAEYFGRDPAALSVRVPAHTIWGELLAETGLIGLVVFVLLFGLILGTLLYGSLRVKDSKESLLSTAMFSSLVGWLIAGIFYSYNSEFFWLVIMFYFIYGFSILGKDFSVKYLFQYFSRTRFLPVALLFGVGFLLIFIGLGSTHLIPWDEAIYAKIAKNMYQTGDYISQRWYPQTVWLEKPPLFMWAMAFSMKIFGVSSFAVRLPSAIAGLALILVLYKFGKLLFDKTVGFFSAFVLMTSISFLYYSRASMLDVTATLFITMTLYFYTKARKFSFTSSSTRKQWIFVGVFCGLAIMTKGIVGLLGFMVIFFNEFYLLLHQTYRGEVKLKETVIGQLKNYFYMVLSSSIVFLPWHLEMYRLYGAEFINTYIGYHVIDRAVTAIEDKGRPFYWYIIVMKVSMRIWFVALLGALPLSLLRSLLGNFNHKFKSYIRVPNYRIETFLAIYALSIFFFFSVAKSKLVWYIMPAYPAFALITGLFITRVVNFLSKFFKEKYAIAKFVLTFLIFTFGLVYLFINKRLVYTGDLTVKQASMIELKDEVFGTETPVLVDLVELPLILFYTDGPFEGVIYADLKDRLLLQKYDQTIIFVTKESRYRELNGMYPDLQQEGRMDEWVLGYLLSDKDIDEESLEEYEEELIKLTNKEDKSEGDLLRIEFLKVEIQTLKERISSFAPVPAPQQ